MTKLALGTHPFLLGFEQLERLVERTAKTGNDGYPPYNIEQTSDRSYRITLAVAGFAILMSLLTLATMRVPQLAPAWATGMTRRRIGQLELVRAIVLALVTALLALPLGLVLAWALLAIVNVAAFGWELPMFLFPLEYARLGLFAIVAAVLAAAWPARRLATTPPAQLLKVFSNER